jgi:uncharacterized delta-60 repeat protein
MWLQPAHSQTPDNFNPGPNYWVSPIVVQTDGKLIFGGGFTAVGATSRGRVARVNASGVLDTTFANPNADDDVYALVLQPDGKLLVGGEFTTLGNQTRYALGRLNTNGTLDTTFSPTVFNPEPAPPITSFRAQAILLQPDGKIVVGGRSSKPLPNGQTLTGGFLWRLSTNGVFDSSFSTGGISGGPVSCLAWQPDGKILVGGLFSSVGGQTRNRIARLNANGSLDTGFNPGLAGTNTITPIAVAFAVQPDGKIIVGGSFITVAGQSQTNLARLDEDGSFDATFRPEVGSATDFPVQSVVLQADGKILVGGFFNSLNGVTSRKLGRLNADGTLATAFNPGANLEVYGLAVQPDGMTLAAGFFSQLNGQSRSYISRLPAPDLATQSLSYSNATLVWKRGGASPEVWRTTFESSANGTNWINLGAGTRAPDGWQLTGATLPPGSTIRARGYTASGGYNAASWFVESRLPIVPQILSPDDQFGIRSNGMFGFTVSALAGSNVVVEASTNLTQWLAIQTNTADAFGSFYFQDSQSGTNGMRFYRARFE